MILKKGNFVRLTPQTREVIKNNNTKKAKILNFTYLNRPEGSRGVQLDTELAGSKWWMEGDLELAE